MSELCKVRSGVTQSRTAGLASTSSDCPSTGVTRECYYTHSAPAGFAISRLHPILLKYLLEALVGIKLKTQCYASKNNFKSTFIPEGTLLLASTPTKKNKTLRCPAAWVAPALIGKFHCPGTPVPRRAPRPRCPGPEPSPCAQGCHSRHVCQTALAYAGWSSLAGHKRNRAVSETR